jgi:hypothetical protein
LKLLRNPVNQRTKKPLTKQGLTKRKKEIERVEKSLLCSKQAVAFLYRKGYLNPTSKKSLYRQEILRRRKVKILFMGIQELKGIEDHLKQVLNGKCDLDRFLVWKTVEPAERRINDYVVHYMGTDMRPDKDPWPKVKYSFNLWHEWAAGKHFEGDIESLLNV